MSSGLNLKILVILLSVGLASTITYWYISSNQTCNDDDTISKTFLDRDFTALEGLNISNNYMESKYEIFNLSRINIRDYHYGLISNETGYNEFWYYEYIIDNGSKVIYENVVIYNNGSITSSTETFEKKKLLQARWVPDMQGFDVGLLKIDSDEVMKIIKSIAKNESWYYDYIHAEKKSFKLYLSGSPLNNTFNLIPIWTGWYEIENGADDGIGDFFEYITVNAVTGEVLNREL
ncbi:MAG: hypothetical protein KAJ51_16590 [Thermoplasmata archaeon]|nr:hypothetical protein [Thermoplasmata archaeon]